MVFKFEGQNVMEFLWGQLPKNDAGNICYTQGDIDGLWHMGFVDTERYPLSSWRSQFEPYRRPDDTFELDHGSFVALEKYRYTGEIRVPFDPMLINEGKYTDEGLRELFDMSIAPSCSLSPEDLNVFLGEITELHRDKDGLIKIGKQAKAQIKQMLSHNPSPLHNLETMLDKMIEEGVDEEIEAQLDEDDAARATTEVARQVSKLSSAPITATEEKAKKLSALEKTKKKPADKPAKAAEEKPTTELKKIRRSRKGMRG
jgi:hypothetical protein